MSAIDEVRILDERVLQLQKDKEKCLMFSEMLCEGDRCKILIDLEQLINVEDDLK